MNKSTKKPYPRHYGVIGSDSVVLAYPAAEIERYVAELEKQEPVAWLVLNSNEGYVERNPDVVAFLEGAGLTKCKPLFTRPAPAINLAERVPDGWKLVPVEPTDAMLVAVSKGLAERIKPSRYRAMLAAAPEVIYE